MANGRVLKRMKANRSLAAGSNAWYLASGRANAFGDPGRALANGRVLKRMQADEETC